MPNRLQFALVHIDIIIDYPTVAYALTKGRARGFVVYRLLREYFGCHLRKGFGFSYPDDTHAAADFLTRIQVEEYAYPTSCFPVLVATGSVSISIG